MPEEGSHCTCLSVTLIGSIFRIDKVFYLQVFIDECKYIAK